MTSGADGEVSAERRESRRRTRDAPRSHFTLTRAGGGMQESKAPWQAAVLLRAARQALKGKDDQHRRKDRARACEQRRPELDGLDRHSNGPAKSARWEGRIPDETLTDQRHVRGGGEHEKEGRPAKRCPPPPPGRPGEHAGQQD